LSIYYCCVSGSGKDETDHIFGQEKLIELSIGGAAYTYPENTLRFTKSDYFRVLLDDKFRQRIDKNGRIFISCSQAAYKEIDHYLTTKKLLGNCRLDVIREAADFFDIDDKLKLVVELENAASAKETPQYEFLTLASDKQDNVKCICELAFNIYDPQLVAHLEQCHQATVEPVKPCTQNCRYPASIRVKYQKQ
jgi:hypothetical protein